MALLLGDFGFDSGIFCSEINCIWGVNSDSFYINALCQNLFTLITSDHIFKLIIKTIFPNSPNGFLCF